MSPTKAAELVRKTTRDVMANASPTLRALCLIAPLGRTFLADALGREVAGDPIHPSGDADG